MNCIDKFDKSCPKVKCGDKCLDFRKVVIPSSMGTDEEGQPYAPENGAYKNAIVYYEASGVSYIYSTDGIYTKIANIEGGQGEVVSVNGKKGVVVITIGELNGLTADQIVTRINSVKAEDKAYTDTKTATAKTEAIASAKAYTDTKVAGVREDIPTKTSDLTNDSNFQTAAQVNAAIAPVSTKVSTVESAIDKNVVNSINVTASASTDTINLADGKINIKTGTTSSETIPFPVASSTSAGVMNSATYQGLLETTDIANGLLEGAVAVSNLPETPTQAQLTTAWENATGREELMNRAVIYDVTNQKLWTYYTNTSTWYPVTAGGGSVEVQPWTNTQAGIVKGSTTDGQIFAENDGTGSVNGWDEVKTDISNLENAGYQTESEVDTKIATAIAPLESDIDDLETGKQDALTAGDNIDITNNVISATDTTYTAGDNITISTDNEISADVPELLTSTGQSTVAGMTQKAITDALASAGGDIKGFKTLTTDDYNYPTSNPTSVATWKLDYGFYTFDSGVVVRDNAYTTMNDANIFWVSRDPNSSTNRITYKIRGDKMTEGTTFGSAQKVDGSGNPLASRNIGTSVENSLTSTTTSFALSANQGKVLKDLIDSLVIKGAGAPTTATVGTVGKLYEDTTNGKLYQCTAVSGSTYTWTEVGGGGGGGPTVVQTRGTSTTDVMSQDAATKLVYTGTAVNINSKSQTGYTTVASTVLVGSLNGISNLGTNNTLVGELVQPRTGNAITLVGNNAGATGNGVTSVGSSTYGGANNASAYGNNAKAFAVASCTFGNYAQAQDGADNSVAMGAFSLATARGEFSIGNSTRTDLYNGTGYRKITNVYDGENAHDAATYGQIQALEARIAALEAQLGNA